MVKISYTRDEAIYVCGRAKQGSIAFIHAHGDNIDLVREWVPKFPPTIIGTCQTPPPSGLINYGGFTDGDRAAVLSLALGAKQCKLYGFDWNPSDSMKRRKLRWAEYIINTLDDSCEVVK